MELRWPDLVSAFFTPMGVVVGGSLFSAMAAILTGKLPVTTMLRTAEDLKLWAILAALGGTFSTIRSLEGGIITGQLDLVGRQLVHILTAFLGAHLGLELLVLMLRQT